MDEGHIAASAPKAAGIPATIADQNFQSIYPHIELGIAAPAFWFRLNLL
ncbi:MAG: hypothetical protein VX529_03750 [Pseudomonadota bacterium]|nr:hypothetical protein [Pseudomonadota bacterium]